MNDNSCKCRIIDFEKYCNKCKYEELKDYEDPCNECLDHGVNYESEKPVKFKEKDDLCGE